MSKRRAILATMILVLLPVTVLAKDISISMALIPGLSYLDNKGKFQGAFPELIRFIDKKSPDLAFVIRAYPFNRSITNVTRNVADAHLPLIRARTTGQLDFKYVEESLLKVSFVLYSRYDNPLSLHDNLASRNIDTLLGHARFFEFKTFETDSLQAGLKRLLRKRSDGFIMEQDAVDALIRTQGINDIHRSLFAIMDSTMIVRKGPEGDVLKTKLAKAIKAARQDLAYQEITARIHAPYSDWQPWSAEKQSRNTD